MNNLIKFISKYQFSFLYFFLGVIAIILIIQNNRYHKAGFINSANFFTGGVFSKYKDASIYLNLKEENEKLAFENAKLLNQLKSVSYTLIPQLIQDTSIYVNDSTNTNLLDTLVVDTLSNFEYSPALVISNSSNKKYNYIFIDKGTNHRFYNNMGIIEPNGVVGVVVNSTNKYSVVMPLINEKSNVSVLIKNQGYFGTLHWETGFGQFAEIDEIPNHVQLSFGDTIITSGYSHIFPKGLLIGFVEKSERIEGNSFLKTKIKLSVDFAKLNYVYAIENKDLKDLKKISIE